MFGGGGTTDVDTSQTESVAESESSEVEPTSTVEMPDGFTKITQEQAESCPDGDGAVKALETALQSIGVRKFLIAIGGITRQPEVLSIWRLTLSQMHKTLSSDAST